MYYVRVPRSIRVLLVKLWGAGGATSDAALQRVREAHRARSATLESEPIYDGR